MLNQRRSISIGYNFFYNWKKYININFQRCILMSNTNFLHKENINTLWDVISDEDIFQGLHRDAQSQILNVFSNNIKGFFETEKTKTPRLVEINKKYIMLLLNYIKQNFSQKTHNKIKILEEKPVKELITYEDIQNDRKSQFEKDLGRIQDEFTNSMTLPVPEVPTFADNYEDTPISEMDKMIQEMTAKRNYEVDQINRNQQNIANDWLQPQETSIKTDKFTQQLPPEINHNKAKHLQLDSNGDLYPKKNVTWGEDEEFGQEESIFKKLKRVDTPTLENSLLSLHQKMDLIIDLLKNKIK